MMTPIGSKEGGALLNESIDQYLCLIDAILFLWLNHYISLAASV